MSVSLAKKSPQSSRRLIPGMRRDSKNANGSASSVLSPTRVGSLAHSIPNSGNGSEASMQALLEQEEQNRMQRRRKSKNPLVIELLAELDAQQLKMKEKKARLVELQNMEEGLKNKMAAMGLAERRQSLRVSRRSTESSLAGSKKFVSNGHDLNNSTIDSDSEGEQASYAADRSQSVPAISRLSTPRSSSAASTTRTPASIDRHASVTTLLKRRKRAVQLQRRTPGETLGFLLQTITLPMKNPDTGENTGEFYDPTFICNVTPNSIAARAGLQEGDQVLEVDGERCAMAKHNHVVDLIKRNQGTVTMLVRFTNDFKRAELHKSLITAELTLSQKQSRLEQLEQAIQQMTNPKSRAAGTSASVSSLRAVGSPPKSLSATSSSSSLRTSASSSSVAPPAATSTPAAPSTPAASASLPPRRAMSTSGAVVPKSPAPIIAAPPPPITPSAPSASRPTSASVSGRPSQRDNARSPDISIRSDSPEMSTDIDLCRADLSKIQGPWGNDLQKLMRVMQSQWLDDRVEYEQDRDRAEVQIRHLKEEVRKMEAAFKQADAQATKLQLVIHERNATEARLELELSKLRAEVQKLSAQAASGSPRRSSNARQLPVPPSKLAISSPPTMQAPAPPLDLHKSSGLTLMGYDSEEEEFV